MIDWFNLAANALWILALAILLAILSYASWQASLQHEKLRAQLTRPGYGIYFDLAAVLFCLGMAGTSHQPWEIGLWGVLGVLFIANAVAGKFIKKSK
jgi:hypothetical protein